MRAAIDIISQSVSAESRLRSEECLSIAMGRRYREQTAPGASQMALTRSRSSRRLRPGPKVGNLDAQRTPLFSAAQRKTGAAKACKALIDFGGIPPAQEDVFGQTAFFYAAKTNTVACVDVLIS